MDLDQVILKCVNDIWLEYCKTGSNSLSKEETMNFIKNTLTDMEAKDFSEADFEACFKEFDKDGSGTLEKEEMVAFIKKVSGL